PDRCSLPGPARPIPRTRRSSAPSERRSASTPAPSAATAPRGASASPELSARETLVSPSAIAASSAARWEIDLSGGGASSPRSGPDGSKRRALNSPSAPDRRPRVPQLADTGGGTGDLLGSGNPQRDGAGAHVGRWVQRHVLDVDSGPSEGERNLRDCAGPVLDGHPQLEQLAPDKLGLEQAASVRLSAA